MPSERAADRVEEARAAIRDDDFERARRQLDDVSSVYDEISRGEASAEARIRAARDHDATGTDTVSVLDGYLQRLNGTRLLRTSFLIGAGTYLGDPVASEREPVLEAAENLAESERKAASEVSDAREAASAIDLPARMAILEASISTESVLVGRSVELSITAGNVGDESATGGEVTLDADSGLVIEQDSFAVDGLAPGEQTVRSTAVRTQSEGQYSIRITLDGTESSDEALVSVDAATRSTRLGGTVGTIEGLLTRVQNASLDETTRESLRSTLGTARSRAEEARRLAEEGQTNAAREAAEAANVALGDFLNAVAGLSDGALDPARRRAFTQLATNGIEQTAPILSEPSGLAAYANDSGIITENGLTEAVDDWVNRDIETTLLRDAIDAWRAETVVTDA